MFAIEANNITSIGKYISKRTINAESIEYSDGNE
jgi:hypothetical protein